MEAMKKLTAMREEHRRSLSCCHLPLFGFLSYLLTLTPRLGTVKAQPCIQSEQFERLLSVYDG